MIPIRKTLAILLLICCYSCSGDVVKDLFEKTPEERIGDIKQQYSRILTEAPHGWKTYFGTSNHLGRWLILMKFSENSKVTMKCDPVDYYYRSGVKFEDPITYRVDYSQSAELVFESFSQFSAWNEFAVDTNADGAFDKYAGPETQFIFEKYENGKLYMKGKSNIGVGKKQDEIITYVFEQATEADWQFSEIAEIKKNINYDQNKGKYQRLFYKGNFLENLFFIDAESRVVLYRYMDGDRDFFKSLPFYITKTGFSLVTPLVVKGVGTVQHFEFDLARNAIVESSIPDLQVAYTNKEAAVQRMTFNSFNHVYLAIEVYHSTGDPIGRNLKKLFDNLRPPYAPVEQHLNVIYFAKNITKDMGKIPFKYPQELTLIYADSDPSYSGKDLYGANPTFVRIPVEFETTENRMWRISLIGSIEQAFLNAYPSSKEYAEKKAKEAIPMLYKLLNERGWGLYAQGANTNNPTVKVMDEEDIIGSFFTLYPYTQKDVDR